MTTDRTTKALLFAIALGLWMTVAGDWLRPTPVLAQSTTREAFGDPQLASIDRQLRNISMDTTAMASSLNALARESALRRR